MQMAVKARYIGALKFGKTQVLLRYQYQLTSQLVNSRWEVYTLLMQMIATTFIFSNSSGLYRVPSNNRSPMVTITTFREMALALPEVSEQPHFESPSFRIR